MEPRDFPDVSGSEVTGLIALGATDDANMAPGDWLVLAVTNGIVIAIDERTEPPPKLEPTVKRLDTLKNPPQDQVIFRLAGTDGHWQDIAAGRVYELLDERDVALDGDESVFIRYMDDCLAIIRAATAHFA